MQFLESIQEPIQAEQLKQAEVSGRLKASLGLGDWPSTNLVCFFVPQEEIEAQKKEWELGHLKSLKEENERALKKEQEQDEILTMSKDEVAQVNNRFKIPNTKKAKRYVHAGAAPGTLRARESASHRKLDSSSGQAKASSRSSISGCPSQSSANGAGGLARRASVARTRTSSRQAVAASSFGSSTPSRQSCRVSKRSSRLNDTI